MPCLPDGLLDGPEEKRSRDLMTHHMDVGLHLIERAPHAGERAARRF